MKNVKNIGDKITYTIDANEKVYGNGVITDVFELENNEVVYEVSTTTGTINVSERLNILPS